MAVENAIGRSGRARRFFFGTNVTILILLVTAVVILLNFLGQRKNVRADLAGGFGSSRLSQRSRNIIGQFDGKIRISTVYTEQTDPDEEFFPKVQDLCDEVREFDRDVQVDYLHTGKDRAELRDRIQGQFGGATEQYRKAVELAEGAWNQLDTDLTALRDQINGIMRGSSWLSGFTVLVTRASTLGTDLGDIKEAREDVEGLVRGEGIPRYKEANEAIKKVNTQLKTTLEQTQDWTKEMDKLVQALSDPSSEFATKTRNELTIMGALLANVAKSVGGAEAKDVPDDPAPMLQEFGKASNALVDWLVDESSRVSAFVKENPAIQQHPKWRVRVQVAIFDTEVPVHNLLGQTAEQVSANVQGIKEFLRREPQKFELQNLVPKVRRFVAQVEQDLDLWRTSVLEVLDEGPQIDEASKAFLAKGSSGEMFKGILERLEEVTTAISELPELELDEVAEGLQGDNIIVIEAGDEVRVVSFDDVWPVADANAARFGGDDEEQRRVFDGDSAIGSAILGMQAAKPFATVILVAYETEPDPQMRQFGQQGRNTGPLPVAQLTTLKEKLKQANFTVKEWNLGAEGEGAEKPEAEEGTEPIYVFLPPATAPPPNPMMRQPPQKEFGGPEIETVRKALGENARAVFLATWDMPRGSMFGPPPPVEYAYDGLLQEDWGIRVNADYRLLSGVPAPKDPDGFVLDGKQLMYMQLSSFTDHPVGKPLQARRMLMVHVCPVDKTEALPEGVTVEPVLTVPETLHGIWAENNRGIERIFRVLMSGEQRGVFRKQPDTSREPPFSVILAGENSKTKSKVLVLGNGFAFVDGYLSRRVTRFEGKGNREILTTDPPPTESLDLMVNAMYWLSGKGDLIAAGPADVPLVPVIEPSSQKTLWLATAGWAFAVLIAGGMMMMVRRK